MEQVIVVTGATDGIGRATVVQLIGAGIRVIAVARNRAKASQMAEAVGSDRLVFAYGDLSAVSEVKRVGTEIIRTCGENGWILTALIHVAGTVSTHRETTVDGYERTFAVNHLAVYQLTGVLLPELMKAPGARVIVVSSRSHRWGFVHFRDVMWKRGYWLLTSYSQSKLMNVLFVRGMAKRIDPKLVSFYAVDPGLVDTGIVAKTTAGIERWIWSWRRRAGDPPEVPAKHLAAIATDPAYAGRSGLLWRDGVETKPSRSSGNARTAARLFVLSDRLVKAAIARADASKRA